MTNPITTDAQVIVAYADADHPHEVMNVAMGKGNYGCHVPLMTVAQHERIVAGLEADATALIEAVYPVLFGASLNSPDDYHHEVSREDMERLRAAYLKVKEART